MQQRLSITLATAFAMVLLAASSAWALQVGGAIDLVIAKTANVASALPGDPVTWTISVTNDSTSAALNVEVTDVLPAGFTYQSSTIPCAGAPLVCTIGNMPGGTPAVPSVVTFDIVTTANHTTAGTCVNQATVTGTDPGGNPDLDLTNNTASATVQCTLPPGSIGDFVWNDANNNGLQDPGEPGIGGVTVTLTGGPGGTSVSAADGFYPLFAGLPAGTYAVTVSPATAPAGMVPTTPTTVNVTLASGQVFLDADFGFYTPPPGQIDLELTKIVNRAVVSVGEQVIWTIGVTNQGPADATGVTVSDLLPAGVTYVSDNSGGAFSSATGVWTIGTLAAGASASLEITTTIDTAGIKVNQAQVATANEPDVDSTPNNCPATAGTAAHEDDCAEAEVGTVLQATSTTVAPSTLVVTGARERTRQLGFLGLATVLLGVALVLAATKRETAPATRRRQIDRGN